ncbi:MAG: hypothetical protein M9907_16170 [Burkholderiaceae bacterium]|nr:hypothetical protein [Burkholderiaceae bacterium]
MDRTASSRVGGVAAATAIVLALGGCAVSQGVRYGEVTAIPGAYAPVPAPLSVGEIVAELRAGRPQADLAADIRERGLLAPARGADIDLLLREGAGSELVDAVRDESEDMLRAAPPAAGVVAAPPVTVVPGYYYGWYPWVPMTFGLWWYGGYDHHRRLPAPGAGPHRPPPPGGRPLPSPRAPGPLKPSR